MYTRSAFNLCYIIYHALSVFTAINLECEAESVDDCIRLSLFV